MMHCFSGLRAGVPTTDIEGGYPVSIPDRDFSGLRAFCSSVKAEPKYVSIPDRDFSGLRGYQ